MAIRALFRKTHELVAVRSFRLDSETMLVPGDKLPERVRLFQRISLYNRRLVGKSDDPWTLALIQPPKGPDPVVDSPDEGEKPESDE